MEHRSVLPGMLRFCGLLLALSLCLTGQHLLARAEEAVAPEETSPAPTAEESPAEETDATGKWVTVNWTNQAIGGGSDGKHFEHVTTKAGLESGGVLVGANKGGKAALVAISQTELIDYQNDNEFEPDKKVDGSLCHYASTHDEQFSHPDAVWWFVPQNAYPNYHIVTRVNGVTCYLTGNTATGTVGLTTDPSKATVWTVRINSGEDSLDNETAENIGFVIYLTGTGSNPYLHLYFDDSTPRGFKLDAQKEIDTGGDYLFEVHKPGTVNKITTRWAQLEGMTVNADTAASEEEIVAAIKAQYTVHDSDQADHSDEADLSWNDPEVRLDTSHIDEGVPGTYEAPVYVNDVYIGDVQVVISQPAPPEFTGSLVAVETVIDFGLSVAFGAFDGGDVITEGFTAKVVGFAPFDASLLEVSLDAMPATDPAGTWGSFTSDGSTITYTPNAILGGVEKMLAVVELSYNGQAMTWRYKQISVIPATIMYYETDGNLQDAFSLPEADGWTLRGSPTGSRQAASGTTDLYGYDAAYLSGTTYSGGSSWYINNESGKKVVSFPFTGTGIDIISFTDGSQGMVQLRILQGETVVKRSLVVNKGGIKPLPGAGAVGRGLTSWQLYRRAYGIPGLSLRVSGSSLRRRILF